MNLTHLTIQDLINENEKLTFLVGAGCSVDPPSCLPAGREMIEAIINYTCAESERQKLLGLKELRFEQLVEILRDQLDPELKIIDYYGQCDTPNSQHFFLANMLKKGNFVITTNFDFLIEYALLQSNIPKDKIIPVITKEDFEKFNNPVKLFKKGKKAVYKIHGSIKNIITEQETRDSLIATIQAFGSGKEGENVFQVEPFKRPLFDNISDGRSLVVMGYSGSDDFDIVPTLMVLKNLKNIIWINFISDDDTLEKIYEIDEITIQEPKKMDKITEILVDIYKMHNAEHIYRVDANTTRLIKEDFNFTENLDLDNFSVSSISWLRTNVKSPDEFDEFIIPYKIYDSFNIYQEAMRCLEKILLLSDKNKNISLKAEVLGSIGKTYKVQGNYPEALKHFEEAIRIYEQLVDLSGKATLLNNIGTIYKEQGKYPEALKHYEESMKIDEQLGDFSGKSIFLNNTGEIYYYQGKYPEALTRFEEALRIDEQLGDLLGKARDLSNIGTIYHDQGKYSEALTRFEEALRIAEQLGNRAEKSNSLNSIGQIYHDQGKYSEALTRFEEALRIAEQLGDLAGKSNSLNSIGQIYRDQGRYPEALTRYEEALKIDEQLGNLSGKASDLNSIGQIYHDQGRYPEALTRYEEALKIDEQLGNLSGKASDLNSIGQIYHDQGKYPEALTRYEEALRIDEQLGDLPGKALCLNKIGQMYYAQGKYPEALKLFKEALRIDEELGDLSGKALNINNIGAIYDVQGKYPEALKQYEEALDILNKLGLSESPDAKICKDNIKDLRNLMKK
ncbi:MAG: tetratricopeptide repeat protein [Promethearchaeota archaeon]